MAVNEVSFNVGEKQFVFYPVPAVIITAGEWSLDPDKIPIGRTAFPAPVTIEGYHTAEGILVGGG